MHDCLLFHVIPSLGKRDIINNVITFGDPAMLWGRAYPWKPPRFRTCKLSNAWRPFNTCLVIGEQPYMSNFPSAKLTSRLPNPKTSCWINPGNFSRFLAFVMGRPEKFFDSYFTLMLIIMWILIRENLLPIKSQKAQEYVTMVILEYYFDIWLWKWGISKHFDSMNNVLLQRNLSYFKCEPTTNAIYSTLK